MKIDLTDKDTVLCYIREHAFDMLKEGGGVFQYPFIDPGAGYDFNLWDWDSFWSAKSLLDLCEYFRGEKDVAAMRAKVIEHAKGNILNFLQLQEEDGFIAMVTTKDGLFSDYLVKEHRKGNAVNQHKPFLAQGIWNVSTAADDFGWFSVEGLLRYLDFYCRHQYDTNSGLYFWRNDLMIGIDNNPTVFGRPDDSCTDIYLNAFLYMEFCAAARLLRKRGHSRAAEWEERRDSLKKAVRELLFDKKDCFFYSADILSETHKSEYFNHGIGVFWKVFPLRIRFWGGFIPAMCDLLSEKEAAELFERNLNEDFVSEYGIRTLARSEPMYNTENSSNPSNWLGAVWIVAQYCIFKGLLRAGMKDRAEDVLARTYRVLAKDIRENGHMSESYVPETGKPMMYGGFLNWDCLPVSMQKELDE